MSAVQSLHPASASPRSRTGLALNAVPHRQDWFDDDEAPRSIDARWQGLVEAEPELLS